MPNSFKRKYHNPNYKKHGINIPFRMLIIGGSGTHKTDTLLELIHRMSGTFEHILICCRSKHEPLYEYLASKIPPSNLIFYEGYDAIPEVNTLSKNGQTLAVFDDLVLEKKQNKIEQYFIQGRKVGKGISSCYLSQSYFKVPKTIRINCNYMLLKKLSSQRDLKMILSEFNLEDIKKLQTLHKYATSDPLSFLMIDIDVPSTERYRNGFSEIIE